MVFDFINFLKLWDDRLLPDSGSEFVAEFMYFVVSLS